MIDGMIDAIEHDELTVLRALLGRHRDVPLAALTRESFANEARAVYFDAVASLIADEQPVDLFTVQHRLKRDAPLGVDFSPDEMMLLGEVVDDPATVDRAVDRLVDYGERRRLWAFANDLRPRLADLSMPAERIRLEHLSDVERAPTRQAMEAVDMMTLAEEPATPSLIDGVVPNGFTTLYAAEGVGKTFVALTMCYAVASGRPWFGRDVRPGNVLYLVGEGLDSIKRRVRTMKRQVGPLSAGAFVGYGAPLRLGDAAGSATLRLLARRHDPSLIVVDTWQRLTGLSNENDIGEQAQAWATLDRVAHDVGASVLVLHHENAAGGMRGRGLPATNADATIRLYRPDEDDRSAIVMAPNKVRDGHGFGPMRFCWRDTPDGALLDEVARGSDRYSRTDERIGEAFDTIRKAGTADLRDLIADYGPLIVERLRTHPEFIVDGDVVRMAGPL